MTSGVAAGSTGLGGLGGLGGGAGRRIGLMWTRAPWFRWPWAPTTVTPAVAAVGFKLCFRNAAGKGTVVVIRRPEGDTAVRCGPTPPHAHGQQQHNGRAALLERPMIGRSAPVRFVTRPATVRTRHLPRHSTGWGRSAGSRGRGGRHAPVLGAAVAGVRAGCTGASGAAGLEGPECSPAAAGLATTGKHRH